MFTEEQLRKIVDNASFVQPSCTVRDLVAEIRAVRAERNRLAAEVSAARTEYAKYWADDPSENVAALMQSACEVRAEEAAWLAEEVKRFEAETGALRAEVAELRAMRGAYEEAADAREAREDALADAEEERSELRAECERLEDEQQDAMGEWGETKKRLEAEAGAMREALTYYSTREYDSRTSTDGLIQYVADEALSSDAGKQTLAQIEAGRALAEAVREAANAPQTVCAFDHHLGCDCAGDKMRPALAAWDRAADVTPKAGK